MSIYSRRFVRTTMANSAPRSRSDNPTGDLSVYVEDVGMDDGDTYHDPVEKYDEMHGHYDEPVNLTPSTEPSNTQQKHFVLTGTAPR